MAHEIITLETLALEIARLRGELATWKALAIKQDRLGTAQMQAVNSGATTGKIAQIATNTANITALQQIVSGMFRVVKVAELPVTGEPQTMYLVPQTDGETLNYCNEYLWIDNAWELVGTTGAMANNGELQIIVNGVTVGTFTANQATNSTASITVPTDTSQLTNGAGYVDATALATALASKQDSLSLTQLAAVNSGITSTDVAQIGANTTAIAGKQDALTTSQLAAVNSGITSADVTQIGTNTGNIATNSAAIVSLQGSKQNTLSAAQLLAVNSGITSSLVTQIGTNQSDITTLNTALGQSLTPSADNTYSLGGASFRYANVYAVTFTGDLTGTASKAIADEDGTSIKTGYVNVAGNQTVTGDKSWTGSNTFNNILPNATNTYSLGSSSYQWSSVYAQTYFYNGTAWGLDKENVWTGNNRFSKNAGLSDISTYSDNTMAFTANANTILFNTRGSSNYPSFGTFLFAGYASGTAPDRYGQLKLVRSTDIKGDTYDGYKPDSSFNLWRVAPHYSLMDFVEAVRVRNDGTVNAIYPIANNATDLGFSANQQWKSVYSQTYYYNGTQWGLDKANVWTGNNSFTSATNCIFYFKYGTSSSYSDINWKDNNDSTYAILRSKPNTITLGLQYSSASVWYAGSSININNDGTAQIKAYDGTETWTINFTPVGVYPTSDKVLDLGTSTNKWKTLNGINPGALSLPSSSYVEIDTTNWDLTGADNSYTPPADGYIFCGSSTGTDVKIFDFTTTLGSTSHSSTVKPNYVYLPVRKNDNCIVGFIGSAPPIVRFYPCLGNV